MAKGKDSICPNCQKQTFHDKGSYQDCSSCGFIGWSWQQPIKNVGKGKGNLCPNCGNQTLHKILEMESGESVRRCATCDYSAIEPSNSPNQLLKKFMVTYKEETNRPSGPGILPSESIKALCEEDVPKALAKRLNVSIKKFHLKYSIVNIVKID